MTTRCPHCGKEFSLDPKWWPGGPPPFAVCEPCERDYFAGYGCAPCPACGNKPGGCEACDFAGIVDLPPAKERA